MMADVDEAELLDLLYDAAIVRDTDGRILFWNHTASERYGFRRDEAIGRRVDELFHRRFFGGDVDASLQRDGEWEGGVRIVCRDGRVVTAPCRQRVSGSRIVELHGPVSSHSEVDLRLVMDHLPGLVSYIDRDLRYRFANRRYTEWFGTAEHEVVGFSVEDVLGAEAFAHVEPAMRRALRGEVAHFETFLAYGRGGARQVSVSYVPDRDPHTGEIPGFIVLVEDITARHQAEQALRASERQYRQIVETAHEGIWIIGPDACTVFANHRMAELLGTSVESMLGHHSFAYVFEEEAEEAGRLFASKMQGDRAPFEFRLRRADGSPIWARISGVPMTNETGEVTGLLGMFTDITSARESEQALRASEERFRTLLANLPDIVSRFDRQGRFIYISPAVERASGLPPRIFLGKSHAEAGIPEPVASDLSERLQQIVRTGTPATVDFEMPSPGGEVRKYHGLGVPEFGDDGSVRTVLTIVHDVTEQRRVEAALRQSNAELEQFAYAAAHDLQEPLRVVGTYTELFLRRYVSGADAGARQAADYIHKGVRQMQELVRDLLAYSRAVHEEPLPPVTVALDDALDRAIATVDGDESRGRIEREPLPLVLGDCGQLAQVFQNLLSNAMKYTRNGQGTVVRVWAERAGAEWVISVRDNGIGFDPKYAERIFGLFKRLHRDDYPGTGVGLGICRRIIERHGGRIWAESDGEGLGATFRFTVRAAPSSEPRA